MLNITKEEWLARCSMVYDLGMYKNLYIIAEQSEGFERFKGGQLDIFADILKKDAIRSDKTLSNDTEAYRAHEAIEILTKQCQACATKKDAWHRRGCGFGCKVGGTSFSF